MIGRILAVVVAGCVGMAGCGRGRMAQMPAEVLEDKIRGGVLGHLVGNLNGLPHEMKYIAEPGAVREYRPGLSEGARTDDDTDIEWVYVYSMLRDNALMMTGDRIRGLWLRHVNRGIWCANLYARHLFELGLEPPVTGRLGVNPWADFNISGSFLAETFGLVSPGMPRTAGRIGLNYTHVAIDGEAAQLTQFVTAMIATAYMEDDVGRILEAGLSAVDEKSVIREVAADVRRWVQENPVDWRATRRNLRDKYTRFGGEMPDKNGVELNTGAAIAALLYGKGDFAETMRTAFNFGWDADCTAGTVGSIVGVIKGERWMRGQGWVIKDVYRNTTRDGMPMDETITKYQDRVIEVARRVIAENGGRSSVKEGGRVYRIAVQEAGNVERLVNDGQRAAELRREWLGRVERELGGTGPERARAAYMGICIGQGERLKRERPGDWEKAVAELRKCAIMKDMFEAPGPAGEALRRKAEAAGVLGK